MGRAVYAKILIEGVVSYQRSVNRGVCVCKLHSCVSVIQEADTWNRLIHQSDEVINDSTANKNAVLNV